MNVRLSGVTVYGVDEPLRSVDLFVATGEVVALIGDATGYSVLRTIAGWRVPRAGVVQVDGKDTTNLPPRLVRDLGVALVDDPDATGVQPPAVAAGDGQLDEQSAAAAVSIALACAPRLLLADRLAERMSPTGYLECLAALRAAAQARGTASLLAESPGVDRRRFDRVYDVDRGRVRPAPA